LLASGHVPTPAAHLLSSHYNKTRSEYYRQLDRASRSPKGRVVPLLLYAVEGYVDALRDQLQHVWEQLYRDRWEQFIYQSFGDTRTAAQGRRRRLVLELSKQDQPVQRSELLAISPKVAGLYAGKTGKTLSRDIHALEDMDLIELTPAGYTAKRDKILAFRPPVPGPAD
jgi:hypothetical protein